MIIFAKLRVLLHRLNKVRCMRSKARGL